MDRRESLKLLLAGGLGSGLLATASCTPEEKADLETLIGEYGRTPEEKVVDEKLMAERFFTDKELATIAILSDIILPADESSGSATDAGVPDFIEFMVKDAPSFKTPLRGGLMWLDAESRKRFGRDFAEVTDAEKMAIVDDIAWPDTARPEMIHGVRFFNRMRNLVASGYFTTRMGFDVLGYKGNTPGVWDGVPEEVLKKHGFAYDEKTLRECLDPATRTKIIEWDDRGNIVG